MFKERVLTLVLFLLGTVVTTNLLAGFSDDEKIIPGLTKVTVTAFKHSDQNTNFFYANNVELEPVVVTLCTKFKLSDEITPDYLTYGSLLNGDGADISMPLNSNQANSSGLFIMTESSDYYKKYKAAGFVTDGGIFVPNLNRQINQTKDKNLVSNTLSRKFRDSVCGGAYATQFVLYARASRNIGEFGIKATGQTRETPLSDIQTVSSDPTVTKFETRPPLDYSGARFVSPAYHKDNQTVLPAYEDAGAIYHTEQGASSKRLNYGFTKDAQSSLIKCDGKPTTFEMIDGSNLMEATQHGCTYLGSSGLSWVYHHHSTVTMITLADPKYPPMQAMMLTGNNTLVNGWAVNQICPNHSSTNRWGLQNLILFEGTAGKAITNGDAKTINGGVGFTLPSAQLTGLHTFYVQTILAHQTGSQTSYSCKGKSGDPVRDIQVRGYDTYGNTFLLSVLPGIGDNDPLIK